MKKIPDKSVDHIFTDLPYQQTFNRLDIIIPFEPLWNEYKRISKLTTNFVLFGQGLFFIDLVCSNRKDYKYDLVWNKTLTSGFLNAKKRPLRQHEQIAIFYEKLGCYNPQMTVGEPLHGKGKKFLEKENVNQNYGDFKQLEDTRKGETLKYPKTILEFQKPHPSKAIHRTEKSVELMRYLIRTFSNEGDLILDNCMGSGTTIEAAILENRSWIGIEKNEQDFDIAQNRIDNLLNKF
jgi:site-specific DNA-methyltransferase (adenine-specific)